MFVHWRGNSRVFPAKGAFPASDMSLGRGLLTGSGWAGTIGAVALAVLVLLFAFIAFSGARRDDGVVKLPSVREGRVALPPPPGRGASSAAPAHRGGGR
jgi:hypothetical protein